MTEEPNKYSMYGLIIILWCCSFYFITQEHITELKQQREDIVSEYEIIQNEYFEDFCRYIDYKSESCQELKISQKTDEEKTVEDIINEALKKEKRIGKLKK